MKNFLTSLGELLKILLISLLIIIPIRYYVIQPFFVKGESMEPTFQNGDYLLVDELSYHFRAPQRGEVIVFRFPQQPKEFFIKRIIGLPNETVKIVNHTIYIYNQAHPDGFKLNEKYLPPEPFLGNEVLKLDKNSYFVMGDNRAHSFDSRAWGAVPRKDLVGRVLFRVWPFNHAMAFGIPKY